MSLTKEFLNQLSQDPRWIQIVKEIKEDIQVPKFNPNDQKRDSDMQADRWRFMSGRSFENERICKILNIEV